MTVTDPSAVRAAVPFSTGLRRAVASEWTRLWTLRSTWWLLVAAAGIFLFIGGVAAAGHVGAEPAPVWQPAQIAVMPGQFAFLAVVLLAVTGEYSTGAMRSTLQWVPKRGMLLAARTLVPVTFVMICSVFLAAASGLLAWVILGETAEVVAADIALSLGRIALVVGFGGLLAVGFGLLLRSTAGTLTVLFLLILALPIALGNTGVEVLVNISDHLPGRAIVSTVVVDELDLTRSTIAKVMATWTVAAMLAGGWSLIRRDTT